MAGVTKDARITIGVDGSDDARSSLGAVKSALGQIDQAVSSTMTGMATTLVRVSTALGGLDLASAAGRYRSYTEEVAHYSAVTGENIEKLKLRFVGLSDRTGFSDEKLARFTAGLQRSAYDALNSERAVGALATEAIATGRSLDEMAGVGTTLHNALGTSFDDIPERLARVRAIAESLGTVGGPAALQDQIVGLGASLGRVSIKSAADVDQMTALIGLLGKGLRPDQAREVQQRFVSFMTTGTEPLRYQLGIKRPDFYDEQGAIKDLPGLLLKVRQNANRRWGSRAPEVLAQDQNLGAQLAAAVMRVDPAEVKRVAQITPSRKAEESTGAFLRSEAGETLKLEHRREREMREGPGSWLAAVQRAVGKTFEGHPFLGYLTQGVGVGLAGAGVKWLFGASAIAGGAEAAGGAATAARGSRLAQGLTTTLRIIGGGSAGVGAAAVGLGLATSIAGFKMAGLDELAEKRPQIESETRQQLALEREGRARALGRAFFRAGGDLDAFKEEIGPALLGQVRRDPALDLVGRGLVEGRVPEELEQGAPDIAGVLREMVDELRAMRAQPPVIQVQDDSGHPNRIVAIQRGARQ